MLLVMVYWCPLAIPVPLESRIAPLTGLGEVCSIYSSPQRATVLLVLWNWAFLLDFILEKKKKRKKRARELDTLSR